MIAEFVGPFYDTDHLISCSSKFFTYQDTTSIEWTQEEYNKQRFLVWSVIFMQTIGLFDKRKEERVLCQTYHELLVQVSKPT